MKKLFIGLTMALGLVFMMNVSALPMLSDITGNLDHSGEMDTGDELFRLTDTNGNVDDATAFLLFEVASYANVNAFGIYDGTSTLELFNGSISPLSSATISWDTVTDTATNLTTSATATINDQLFGFYLESGDGNTYYSQASLNGGLDMMLVFDVGADGYADLFGSNLVMAFEDLSMNSDWDYSDMVVGMSDISPVGSTGVTKVPEPMPLALMGLGMIGLAGFKKYGNK